MYEPCAESLPPGTARDLPAPGRSAGAPTGWRSSRDAALLAVGLLLALQVVHAAEHVLQVVAWTGDPTRAAMSPLAVDGARALGHAVGDARLGAELLHLLGNVAFAVAVLGVAGVDRADAHHGLRVIGPRRRRLVRMALVAQLVHCAEHVALTTTTWLLGRPLGATTLLGVLESGEPEAVAVRVWAHAALNAVPTLAIAAALATDVGRRRSRRADVAHG